MLSISNFGSSTNCKSSQMHAYVKSWAMPPVPNQIQWHAAVWYAQGVVNTLLFGEIKCLSDL